MYVLAFIYPSYQFLIWQKPQEEFSYFSLCGIVQDTEFCFRETLLSFFYMPSVYYCYTGRQCNVFSSVSGEVWNVNQDPWISSPVK